MFLNIVTPCSRPENLKKIAESINIPRENYRWIVVVDMDNLPQEKYIPENCEMYLYRDARSIVGHAQRNFAIELIQEGHVYMNDDDTVLHLQLWESIKHLDSDFISFKQNDSNGRLRLEGDIVRVGHIDSHNFIVSKKAIENEKWIIDRYDADGYFANAVYTKVNSSAEYTATYLPAVLSTYNSLRE
tara:strand:- start:467 stop:1027 length:561 start_codon:yes stop_codon:yes gene_type:complete